jgi:hypothetical protein
MMHSEFPGPRVVGRRRQREAKTADARTIDRFADVDYVVFIRDGEIDISGESALIANATFAQAGSTLENDAWKLENIGQLQQMQQMVLRDIEQSRLVGFLACACMAKNQRACQRHQSSLGVRM